MKNDEGQKLSSEYSWWREGSWNPWSRKKTRANEGAALCSPRRRWQTAGFAELVMKSRTDTGGCWGKLSVHSGQPELMELSFKWDSSSLSGKVETAPTCWRGLKGYTWRHLSSWNLSYRSTNCSHKNICPRAFDKTVYLGIFHLALVIQICSSWHHNEQKSKEKENTLITSFEVPSSL